MLIRHKHPTGEWRDSGSHLGRIYMADDEVERYSSERCNLK